MYSACIAQLLVWYRRECLDMQTVLLLSTSFSSVGGAVELCALRVILRANCVACLVTHSALYVTVVLMNILVPALQQ
jgi:NAD(P)H-dependent FMN reductase